MDAIPAGMELFAAGNTDQWTLIEQVIDRCDYYIVIVGGRYGTVTEEGISYTEKEYDYAVSQGIPIMGFVHANPDLIPAGKTELSPEARQKLDSFREKVKKKVVKQYSTPAELGGVVSRGLIRLQKEFPRPGWVRGDLAMTAETEARIAELRAEVAELRQREAEKHETESVPKIEGLASGEDRVFLEMKVTGTSKEDEELKPYLRQRYIWTLKYSTTWNEILQHVGPPLIDEASEREITRYMKELGDQLIYSQREMWPANMLEEESRSISESSVNDAIVQFFALGLVARGTKKRTMSDTNRYWTLTPAGQDQVMKLRAARKLTPEARRTQRHYELTALKVSQLREIAIMIHDLDGKGSKAALIDAILTAEGHDQSLPDPAGEKSTQQ